LKKHHRQRTHEAIVQDKVDLASSALLASDALRNHLNLNKTGWLVKAFYAGNRGSIPLGTLKNSKRGQPEMVALVIFVAGPASDYRPANENL
jgi:hypothetical protein